MLQHGHTFLSPLETVRGVRLIEAVDRLNKKYGQHTPRPLSMGCHQDGDMKWEPLSGRYTTRLDEVLKVRA